MSEENKTPPPPPDDFSKTTPNIALPEDDSAQSDWDKTNYNFPKQPPADDWGKTVTNIKPIDTEAQDLNKTFFPGARKPSTPEWGMTEANIDMADADFGSRPEDFAGADEGYGKTTPYFRLPEAERAKYQNLPATPADQAAQEKKEEQAKGGIPGWVWVSGGLMAMFFFAVVVLLVVYFFILRDTGFEATVKGAPPGSTITVNGSPWGVTVENGSIKLPILKEGETKRVEILHPTYTCQPTDVKSENGVVSPNPIIARCTAVAAKSTDDCGNIHLGEDDKAERCYNSALDALDALGTRDGSGAMQDKFTAEELVKALNILIINFESGKSNIPPVRLAALQKGAGFIKRLPPSVVLEVGGHTDNVGNDTNNQTLSESRANAVKDALVKFGVSASVLQTKGYGKTKPITTNDTDNGRFRNRRIEYSIVKK